jgi:hypothetical protein
LTSILRQWDWWSTKDGVESSGITPVPEEKLSDIPDKTVRIEGSDRTYDIDEVVMI